MKISTSERDHVEWLWTGLRVEIQKDLWQEKLHPEFSSYKKVLRAAELVEVIASVGGNHMTDAKGKQKASASSGPSLNTNPKKSGPHSESRDNHKKSWFGRHGKQTDKHCPNKPSSSKVHFLKPDNCPSWKELSEKDKACYKSEGLCFRCGKSGHMTHQCPDGKFVPLEKKGAPPGLQSANMNIEDLCSLAETTEDLHELKVRMIRWIEGAGYASSESGSEDEYISESSTTDSTELEIGNSNTQSSVDENESHSSHLEMSDTSEDNSISSDEESSDGSVDESDNDSCPDLQSVSDSSDSDDSGDEDSKSGFEENDQFHSCKGFSHAFEECHTGAAGAETEDNCEVNFN